MGLAGHQCLALTVTQGWGEGPLLSRVGVARLAHSVLGQPQACLDPFEVVTEGCTPHRWAVVSVGSCE